ncbi:MAG TPA: YbdD/YjiX family protein [Gemmatimonadaceae bacterium]|nr:YbdD/YjiX family protein [Gemmatimonadaceae bacterium]
MLAPQWLERTLKVVRTVIGAPDYERYVAHMRDHHPGCEVVSHDEFMKQRLENRYSRPGSRCC